MGIARTSEIHVSLHFFSAQSKNRVNFLNLISGGRWIFRVDQVAIERMRDGGLSQRTTATVFQLPFEKAKQISVIELKMPLMKTPRSGARSINCKPIKRTFPVFFISTKCWWCPTAPTPASVR